MRISALFVVLVTLTSFGCGKTGGGNPIGPGSVGSMTKVTVIDQVSGAPISGIRVSTSSEEGITGSDGTVVMNLFMGQKFSASDDGLYLKRTDIWRGTPVQMFRIPGGLDTEILKNMAYAELTVGDGTLSIKKPEIWPMTLQLLSFEVQTPVAVAVAQSVADKINTAYGLNAYVVTTDTNVSGQGLICRVTVDDPNLHGAYGAIRFSNKPQNRGIITGCALNIPKSTNWATDPGTMMNMMLSMMGLAPNRGLLSFSQQQIAAMIVHRTLPVGTQFEYDTSNLR